MEREIKNLRKNLNEDNLIEQQSEFLKESKNPKFQPAISKLYKSKQVIEEQDKRPKFDEPSLNNIFMPLNIVEHDTSNFTVDEIEKNLNESMKIDNKSLKFDLTNFKSAPDKKKSIFAQFMNSKRQKLTQSSSISSDQMDIRKIIKDDNEEIRNEIKKVRQENDELWNNLDETSKNELLNQLSDQIKKAKSILSSSNKQFKKESTISMKEIQDNERPIESEQRLLNQCIDEEEIEKNKWLNMDKVEIEKFEWMKPLVEREEKKKISSGSSVEGKAARFNFEGDLIVNEESDVRKGLHHHNEQDTSSGYTINDLITLTQSKYIPQRILALNTLSNIFKRMHRGYFDICFDKSLTIELIEQTELLILLRGLLDDSNTSLQLVTIKCIHSLICNTIYDEFCLDRLFCSMELGIEIPKLCCVELNDEKDLKDEQLCKLDVIGCLIRINILARLRYLMDSWISCEMKDEIVIDYVMDILIRICRHSTRSCDELIKTPYLLECLINNFICSPITLTSILNWKALKVIRILFTTDKQNIILIKKQFSNLWISLGNYLVMNRPTEDEDEIYPCIIEVLRIWRVLLILDNESIETTDQFKCELAGNIKSCLKMSILTNNSFDLHYVSNLLHCLVYVIQKLPVKDKIYFEGFFTPLIQDLTFRWFNEMKNYNQLPKLDGCLALSSALLYLNWSCTTKEQLYNNILEPFLNSNLLFNKLTDQLIANSSILNFKEYHNSIYRDSKALSSYGSIYFGGSTIKLNQLLNEDSIIFLIGPLIGLAAKHQLTECLEQFIYNSRITFYLNQIVKKVQKTSNSWSIFELIEFNLISQIILWERNVLNKAQYFDSAFAILSSVGDVQLKKSLCEYVFDIKQYKSIYDQNKLDDITDELIKSSICFFNEIKKVYSKFSNFDDRNWIFEPLIRLYKSQLDNSSNSNQSFTENELTSYLSNCLYFLILLYNFKSDYLWSIVEPKILFVYLSSIFLFKNGLFLNEELLKQLKYFLIQLTSNHKIYFDCFEEKIPEPFNSIGDHFNSLCINYKTDSYGNYIFSNYLICFLTQSSDKIFRKKLLDEHSTCLNYFILNRNQLLIKFEHLITPIEFDLTIIESYIRILMAKDILKQRNPLIYEIACIHILKSLFDKQNQQYHENRIQNNEIVQKLIKCLEQSTNNQLKQDLGII